MSKFLFDVQEKNRLVQKGLLKRFSIDCIGHQETVEEMRAQKTEKYNELKNNKNSTEYEEWFLRYRPTDKTEEQTNKNKNKTKTNIKKNKKRKTRKSKSKGIFF